jgi:DNA-binding transcriptional MerR regulator
MNAQPARPYLGIGEVLAQLRGEFPDISVSKIRFLESEGLIAPARSPSGYRKFGVDDIERLRYILTAQRDQYLPLRVIKERLVPPVPPAATAEPQPRGPARRDTPARRDAPARREAPVLRDTPVLRDSPVVRDAPARPAALTRRELLDAAGINDDQLAELEDFGLVRREGRQYSPDALEVTRTVVALAAYGVGARHLRGVRAAAERETSLIEQVVAPVLRQRSPGARENAGRTAREIAVLSLRLHRALIEAALAEAGLPGAALDSVFPGPAAQDRAGLDQAFQPGAGQGGGGLRAARGYGGASA